MPLALDARAVRVEGLADADHIQARLVRQLLHQRSDLLDRLAVDALLAHSPVKVFGHNPRHTARPRVHVYYDPGIPSGEVSHLMFHELPGAAGRGRVPAEAKAEALQLLYVATQPIVQDTGQEAASGPARRHGHRSKIPQPNRAEPSRADPGEMGERLTRGFRFREHSRRGSFASEVTASGAHK